MVITCPSCNERYRLSADKIQGKGAKITCPSCSHLFVVFADNPVTANKNTGEGLDTTTGAFRAVGMNESGGSPNTTGSIRVVAPGPRKKRTEVTTVDTSSNRIPALQEKSHNIEDEALASAVETEVVREEQDLKASELDFREVGIITWKVKVSIGLVYDFSDIMTLKKYLDDQKVTPDDLISHNAKDWVRIGDVGNLDEHFVRTWKAARQALKEGSGAKKKTAKKAAKETTEDSAEAQEAMAAAAREIDGARNNFGPAMEDPFAKAREQRRAGKGRRRPKTSKKEKSSAPMGAIAALLVVGGLAVGFSIMQPGAGDSSQASLPDGNSAGTPNNNGDVEVPDIEAHRDTVRAKIREQMQRRQEEIQAGMDEEPESIAVEGEADPLEEAMRKARRVPVRPDEQPPRAGQVDSKGFRKPIVQPIANNTKHVVAPTSSNKGSAQMTEHKTRDPGRLYYDNGRRAMERKNYGSALKMFQTSVDKSPQCGSCWEGLASAYQVLGEAQKAAEAFKKAEELGVPVNAARP